jgi:acetylcholinesterase
VCTIISLLYDVYISLFIGLTLDIVVPAGTTASSKLPVLFVSFQLLLQLLWLNCSIKWIYGGGFEVGSTQNNNGTTVVARSVQLGEPVIYAAANYRLNGMCFFSTVE